MGIDFVYDRVWRKLVPSDSKKGRHRVRGFMDRFVGCKKVSDDLLLEGWFRRVEVSGSGCWIWNGRRFRDKGLFYYVGKKAGVGVLEVMARRFGFEHLVGKLDVGEYLRCRCHEWRCVNPEHLEKKRYRYYTVKDRVVVGEELSKVRCVKCGCETEWSGNENVALCLACWDNSVDEGLAWKSTARGQYYFEHSQEFSERMHRWYLEHKAEVLERRRDYYLASRDLIKAKHRDYSKGCREENKEKVNERYRRSYHICRAKAMGITVEEYLEWKGKRWSCLLASERRASKVDGGLARLLGWEERK